jgi:hypothetical protein
VILDFSSHSGLRIAEVGFLLFVIAGIWFAAAELPQPRWIKTRRVVAGILLALGGVLLIVAVHWGHFG